MTDFFFFFFCNRWIHVFAGVNAVIFVMSLNGYDKVLFEDNSQNCWDETFQLFGDVTSLKEFKLTDFIVFLNKADLFEETIQQVPFSNYYKECPPDEEHNPTYVINYVQAELTQRFSLAADRPIEKTTPNFRDDIETVESLRALHFHNQTQIETVLKVIQFEAVKNQLQKAAII
ncbi:hypothetical protein RFI_30607 [Reticulomyxa filosa]|uniref:Uncharacterized protein n=1 Tax=Reticulomyxa filosa TaxID=46433 RepID=X6LZL0_RETFI|nr:hypothetical protein RFI_30607 [Reticulomyxa filosa]|eukprot:ETO06786.1 hypothetical protein RFI_30607 [Reticulomyxa filosa]